VSIIWQLSLQPSSPSHSRLGTFVTHDVFLVYRELFGVFGWADTTMHPLGYAALVALVAALLLLAWRVATIRERLLLLVLLVVPLLIGAGISALIEADFGRAQGRWLLPVAVAAPLFAGELVFRNRDRLSGRLLSWAMPVTCCVVGAVQAQAWWMNGRRHAVGADGPINFLSHPAWSPPQGWGIWLALALVGAAALAAFGFAAGRDRGAPATSK
jgi:hypothetical protein